MNPVHSSLCAPLFSPPGHFHAISNSPNSLDTSTLMGSANKSTQQKNPVVEFKTARRGSCRAEDFPQRESYFIWPSFDQAIVQAHQLGVVIEFEHKLTRPHFGFEAQN